MITTVVFELSGTLVDWDTTVALGVKDILPEIPAEFQPGLPERVRAAMTELKETGAARGLVQDPTPLWRMAMPGAGEALVKKLARRSLEVLEITLYEDVPSTLLSMREQYSLGVVSANPSGEKILARAGIGHLFDAVVSTSPAGSRGQSSLKRALTKMKAEASQTAYAGCAYASAREASELGVMVVWVARGDDPGPVEVQRISSLEELPGLLANSAGAA